MEPYTNEERQWILSGLDKYEHYHTIEVGWVRDWLQGFEATIKHRDADIDALRTRDKLLVELVRRLADNLPDGDDKAVIKGILDTIERSENCHD